ncbi:MAG: hypothetical protein KIT09_34870 [Bryobacteraceae bacterium]|nr:hypothetical protein [Bryobacteraceae bacterium]
MFTRRAFLLTSASVPARIRAAPSEFSVDAPHPRLLLPARRLRLLRRERERDSMRWAQFHAVMRSAPGLPEAGFAHALYYLASGEREYGRRAVAWALEGGSDLRQLALVFDWCQELLADGERERLAERMRRELERPPAASSGAMPSIDHIRSRLLAAVALAHHVEEVAERELQFVVREWWGETVIPALKRGESPIGRNDSYPLMEVLHAVRDNVGIDLREDFKGYFSVLPLYHLLTYYPASYPGATNELHIPLILDGTEPDLAMAVLSRAAELSMVAYDANALEVQFLQGWCMQDRFLMRDAFGIPYEFLWANPYHPGLSYYNAPLVYHDGDRGRLVLREHWDEGAKWFYYEKGRMQTFTDGAIAPIAWEDMRAPVAFGAATVWPLKSGLRFRIETDEPRHFFLIGLEPQQKYDIEVDDEEMYEDKADAGGIVVLEAPAKRRAGVRLRKAGARRG